MVGVSYLEKARVEFGGEAIVELGVGLVAAVDHVGEGNGREVKEERFAVLVEHAFEFVEATGVGLVAVGLLFLIDGTVETHFVVVCVCVCAFKELTL